MKKVIIYYPFPLREPKSGSTVRPIKMLQAFKELAQEKKIKIIDIVGESSERNNKIKQLCKNVDPKDILFCYIENSTLPIWLTDKDHLPRRPLLEFKLFSYLSRNNIPIGLFYRDIYWLFKDEYPLKGLKRLIMKCIYRMELYFYKSYVTHFFLPSIEMNKYTKFKDDKVYALPPGSEIRIRNIIEPSNKKGLLTIIYVGGISEKYGLDILLKAVALLNSPIIRVRLILVCRENEFKKYINKFKPYLNKPWLEIFHAHGSGLDSIYEQADIAVIPRLRTIYNDFAVPVKLFEYVSYGLPIVATNCTAQAKIIKEQKLGIITHDDERSLARAIECFFDEEYLKECKKNIVMSLKNNLWINRAEKVFSIMTNPDYSN